LAADATRSRHGERRVRVVGAAVEFASAGFWAVTAPLLEEESDAIVLALITQHA
jgi:hypothetical protein